VSWSLAEQVDDIASKIARFARFRWPAPYVATDREIALVCLLMHHEEYERDGVVKLPSGARVGLDGAGRLYVRGKPAISDLPEDVRPFVERMPRRFQAEREAELPSLYERNLLAEKEEA
jgi:hypothetical protein